jgi:uncharacterized protein (DUF58 family)
MHAVRTREAQRAVRQVEAKTRRLAEERLAGRYRAAATGRGVEVTGLRPFVRGDDSGAIDAKVTARTGVRHARTTAEERERALLLMVDLCSSGAHGSDRASKREFAAEVASALAFSAIRNGDKVGLLLFSDRAELYLPPRRSRSHVLRIVRAILFVEAKGRRANLAVALDHASRVLKRRALAFLVSDFLMAGPLEDAGTGLRTKLKAAQRRHDIVAVSVTDPRELRLPDIGVVTLEDTETGEHIEIDTSSEKARDAYRRAADRYYAEVGRLIRSSGVDHIALSTATPYLPALMAFFGRRRGRRAT